MPPFTSPTFETARAKVEAGDLSFEALSALTIAHGELLAATDHRTTHEARLVARWGRDYIAEFDACQDWAGEYPEDWDGPDDVAGYDLQRFARMIDRASNPLALLQMQPGPASDLAWALG